MSRRVRDWLGNLVCQVPGCEHVIEAMTGLQEIGALRLHFRRDHLAEISMPEALELRAEWESREERSA